MKCSILLLLITLLLPWSVETDANVISSDAKALRIADESVKAMGGRENYNNTRFITWVFFGNRFHVWDKYTGDIRIEYGKQNILLMNIHSKKGRAWEGGVEITEAVALADKMNWGYETWINDSYWVVMPYKLHDTGVTLRYTREDKSLTGRSVDVLTMTFEDVGVTPDNKYEVFFDKETKLLSEFSYYPTSDTSTPKFRLPWNNWQYYDKIKLSDSRGKRGMAPINVYSQLPKSVLTTNKPAKTIMGVAITGAMIH